MVLGYAALVAWRREPLATAEAPAFRSLAAELAAPRRLPPAPDLDNPFASGPAVSVRQQPTPLVLELGALPEDFPTADAGVAIFDRTFGARIAWVPLQDFGRDRRWTSGPLPSGPLGFHLAIAEDQAAHGYLTRIEHRHGPTAGRSAVELPAAVQRVHLQAPADHPPIGPLQLLRVAAPDWRSAAILPAGISLEPGAELALWLGPGHYEIGAPGGDTRQEFAVPSPQPVVLNGVRPPARTRRP